MKKQVLLFHIFLIFSMSGCAQLQPLIQDVNIISIQQEKELGDAMAKEVLMEMPLVRDRRYNNPVNIIGQRLVNVISPKQFDFRFYVVHNPQPNAFNIPGGYVFIHSGLMEFASDHSELAGVMAHELGHAIERHTTKSLTRQYGLAGILSRLTGSQEPHVIQQMVLGITSKGVLNSYGRNDEREADVIAFKLLQAAGYPTDGLLRFLKKIEQLEGGRGTTFLSTHPATPERIERLKQLEASG